MNRVVHQVQARKLLVNFHFQELQWKCLVLLILSCIYLAIGVEDRFPLFHIQLNYSALPKIHLETLQSDLYFDFEKSEVDFRLQFARPDLIFWR